MKALLLALALVACGAEPIEPEPAQPVAESINVDQPPEAEKWMLGVIDGGHDKANGQIVSVSIRYAGPWIAFEIIATDPETDCKRTNGYAESVANMVASATPRRMGHQQAVAVMRDMDLAEPVCP